MSGGSPHYSLSRTERRAPIGTFWDAGAGIFRAQVPLIGGKRFRGHLKTPEGDDVRDEEAARSAMIALCQKLQTAGTLDLESNIARVYLGAVAGAEIIPIPLSPRAPAPPVNRAPRPQAPIPGWHGMDVLSIGVDHRLVYELTPDGSAVKVGVNPRTGAAQAGLRTGDYVLTIGERPDGVPLAKFDSLHLPAWASVIVRFHRPGHHRPGEIEMRSLKLGRPPRTKPTWWERFPKAERGRQVGYNVDGTRLPAKAYGADRAAFAGQMAGHPHMPKVAHQILIRLLSYYGGKDGAFPAYSTLAKDVGCRRRQTAVENVHALEWLGLLGRVERAGPARSSAADRHGGGPTNLFVIYWPEGWQDPRQKKSSSARWRTT